MATQKVLHQKASLDPTVIFFLVLTALRKLKTIRPEKRLAQEKIS